MLVSPTTPFVAFPFGSRTSDPYQMYLADLFTIPTNLYGGPGISVPCGLSDGLPVGFQIMAPTMADDRMYRVAAALESAVGTLTPPALSLEIIEDTDDDCCFGPTTTPSRATSR